MLDLHNECKLNIAQKLSAIIFFLPDFLSLSHQMIFHWVHAEGVTKIQTAVHVQSLKFNCSVKIIKKIKSNLLMRQQIFRHPPLLNIRSHHEYIVIETKNKQKKRQTSSYKVVKSQRKSTIFMHIILFYHVRNMRLS